MIKPTRSMSAQHENWLAMNFQGRITKNSGAVWSDQMDGKQTHGGGAYVFAWDGKSTLGKSIGVTLEMWTKAVEQAHWAIPILPLRWYGNERLTQVLADLVVVEAKVLADIQDDANLLARIKDSGCLIGTHVFATSTESSTSTCAVCGVCIEEIHG